jgi:hypothetical protein
MGKQHKLYACGQCGGYHPWTWYGDCREDANRYGGPEEYAEAKRISVYKVEVIDWEA